MSDSEYKYRYEITHTSGEAPVEVGAVIVETRWMGRWHTWTIFNFATARVMGTFSGRYLGMRNAE